MEFSFEELLKQGGVILSLPRYENRFRHTKQRLEEVGFQNLQFYQGVDGFHDDLAFAAKNLGFSLTYDTEIASKPGHIGCTLSHISLWKKIVDEQLPYLFIFEDDALPHPKFREVGSIWWDKTPRDVDMILIGNQMDPKNSALYDPQNLILKCPAFCLHAYLVTQKGAQKLMQLVKAQPILKMNDVQVLEWMSKELIDYACWNGAWIEEKTYEIFTQHTPLEKAFQSNAMIVERRDTGLIYQNFCLGHTLACENPIYNVVLYASE